MGEEIEKYILKKLDDAIEESKDSTHFNIAARFLLPNLHKDLSELKDLIEKKRTKIKLAIAPAPAPAPRHTPAVRDPSAPAAAVRAPFAPCATAPTPHPTPASTSSASAKKDSKVLLPAAENKSQTPPNAADDKKDTPNPTDALGDKKDTHTGDPLDAIDDKKDPDTSAPLDAIGDKKDTGAPLDAIGDKKELDAPPDTGDKKDTDTVAPTDVGDKKDTGAPLDAIGHKKELDAPPDTGDKKDTDAPLDAMGDKKELDAPPDTGDKKDTDAPLDAGDEKESGAPSDAGAEKESTASSTGASEKESASDAGAEKESGAPLDAGAEKESGAPLDAGAPLDDIAVDKKESTAPLDANDEKDKGAPLADSAEKESKAPLARTSSKTTSPDHYPTGVGGVKKQDNVGTSDKTTSQDESEISPATDNVTGDKSITPPSPAGGGQKESNDSDESEISPVTDGGATDHKSKTPTSAGGGKEESGISHADKSTTTAAAAADTSTKSDSNSDAIKREEALLREQLYYLNNVLTEWQMITKKPFSYSDSVSSIKDLSKTLKKIKQDLKPESIKKTEESSDSHIPQTGSSDNASQIETTHEVMEFRWSTPVEPKNVHGFDARILSLERLLVLRRKDTDAFKAFGIHGMAGVGKTTLCQSIFRRPKVMKYFFPRIWVCLSKQKGEDEDNKKEVVKRMLRCLGIDDNIIKKVDEKQGIRGLLSALRLQLTGKRYFIVLDDAHNADKWFKMSDSDAENDNNKIYEKFSYGLPKEWGGTVLVTSRVEQVVKNMVGEEENLRCIEPLTDQDTCWNIFKDTVEKDGIQFPVESKLEIVKRCDGLPLAAKLLGQIKHEELRKNRTAAGNQQAAVQAAK